MSLKRKLRAKKPPLSLLDKFVYIFLSAAVTALFYIYLLATSSLSEFIAYSSDDIVAFNNDSIFLATLPSALLISFSFLLTVALGYNNRQPIFGNKKFKPKVGTPVLKVYPIFSKEFKTEVFDKKKEKYKRIAKYLLIAFIVSLLIIPLGVYPRTQLNENNVFTTYNLFNNVTDSRSIEDFDKLIIKAYSDSGKNIHYGIALIFKSDKKTYKFKLGNFSDMSKKEALLYMLELKEYFDDGRCEIDDKRLESLLFFENFTNEEEALIRQLFS